MNVDQPQVRLMQAGAVLVAAALIAGCGNNYRPVVTPVNTSGPAAQPSAYAVVVSATSASAAGEATIVDYSGDTIMAEVPLLGLGPIGFALDEIGANGYSFNSNGTVTNFPISTSLQQKDETYTTLPPNAVPVNLYAPTTGLWITDLNGNAADLFTSNGGTQTSWNAVPVAATPVFMAGAPNASGGQRHYVLSQNFTDSTGMTCNTSPRTAPASGVVTPIEISSDSTDVPVAVGKCPVYAVTSQDQKRLFVLNRGSDTVSVIDMQRGALDSCTPFKNQNGQTVNCHPTLPLSLSAVTATSITPPNGTSGMTATAGPVYAEYNAATQQLVVANYDGGTVSIIDVSLDQYGNDSSTFGTTYTVPVGNNPASVTVLYDGSRAYTANQTDQTVTIVNLSSHSVEKTLGVVGHPRTVASTQNSIYGKVYVASPDSTFLTIIQTQTDLVDTTLPVEGNIVDVRTTNQNGTGGNALNNQLINLNFSSRIPGYGQPCNLPGVPTPSGSQTLLQACRAIP